MANRYMLPVDPYLKPELPVIYPWENDSFILLCRSLYNKALDTGYDESFEDFQDNLGKFIKTMTSMQLYDGVYSVVPMAEFDQVLPTQSRIMEENVIIEKIPRYDTSNSAGGYTVVIG